MRHPDERLAFDRSGSHQDFREPRCPSKRLTRSDTQDLNFAEALIDIRRLAGDQDVGSTDQQRIHRADPVLVPIGVRDRVENEPHRVESRAFLAI